MYYTRSYRTIETEYRGLDITRSNLNSIFCGLFVMLCFTQCATPVPPKGGPKDEIPPQVVEEESTPNPMINFNLEEIRITLDEWVQLRDAATQIVISPPIEPRPVPRLDRKTVVIPIDLDMILDNTTYTINFGESISDITERNALVNHSFVFSTGPFVDSLSISGYVINAQTGEPEPAARFILHDNPSDTAIFKLLPSYFSTTDENGHFLLNYLRADTFSVFAIMEAEYGNYRYDVGDQIGFLDEPIILQDTVSPEVTVWIYYPVLPLRAVSVRDESGVWKISFTAQASSMSIAGDTASVLFWTYEADTLKLWHNSSDTLEIEILERGDPFDTVLISPYAQQEGIISIALVSKKVHPEADAIFAGKTPMSSINKNLISVSQGDSANINAFELGVDRIDPRKIFLRARWAEKANYHVRFEPGALTDVYGNSNDSLLYIVSFDERVNFGLLNLTLTGIDSNSQYVVQLLDKETIVESRIVTNETTSAIVFNRLPTKNYIVKIIHDQNGNGKWDTGDLETKRQPERIFVQKIEGMRPGWDFDLTLRWPEK